ncbi:uncharacterized protein LOC127855946 [Dreissena polymorpha]|uniref:Uncharacterized protein n=1 Tax=Dreissena polymorpha TaxID=45954 RepID=A0A9D4C2E5_DREPO|nr:uncharacterized protein LOC127855946 [Dreissena polymorpha]XP_052247834.1 uncharacterized protein LOC127855946 [Dreissena polymorpha]KAH3716081.1 hypothetical protein DPMN_058797 [Dreissena polymorpha]
MSFPYYSVATLSKRAIYKTEFDIFKRSTDIDLISLISYDEEPPLNSAHPRKVNNNSYKHQLNINRRPETVPETIRRQTVRTNLKSAKNANPSSRYLYRRQKAKSATELSSRRSNEHVRSKGNKRVPKSAAIRTRCGTNAKNEFTKTSQGKPLDNNENQKDVTDKDRLCQSACDIRDKADTVREPPRSRTTCGFNQDIKLSTKTNRRLKRKKGKLNSANHTYSKTEQNDNSVKKIRQNKVLNNEYEINGFVTEFSDEGYRNIDDPNIKTRVSFTENTRQAFEESTGSDENNLSREPAISCADECTHKRSSSHSSVSWPGDESTHNRITLTTGGTGHDNKVIESNDSGVSSYTATPDADDNQHPVEADDISEKRVAFNIVNVNKEELENCSGLENSECDSDGICDVSYKTNNIGSEAFDFSNNISEIEGLESQIRISTSSGIFDAETNSLISHQEERRKKHSKCVDFPNNTKTDINKLAMSKEARHAIRETLNDMGVHRKRKGGVENGSHNILHKSVKAQRKMNENRNKYDCIMRERSKSFLRNQFESMDSLGNDENSSHYSSPSPLKEYDDASSEDLERAKLFPAIRENTRLSRATLQSNSKTNAYSLEQAKKKNYKIPGIGNYKFVATPDDFEITPPGFDSRYNHRPIISEEEKEIPPRLVRERSIQKCQNWLSNVSLSPMSLKPVRNSKKHDA